MTYRTPHDELVQAAKDAIDAVQADTSVPPTKTLESLSNIMGYTDIAAEALRSQVQEGDEDDEKL